MQTWLLPPRTRAVSTIRRLFLERLQSAFDSKELNFFSALERFRDRREFLSYLYPLSNSEWIVYAKPPFAGPEKVLDYVGRYTHRVAISNNRLLDIEDDQVTFRYKDYKDRRQQKTMSLHLPPGITGKVRNTDRDIAPPVSVLPPRPHE